jgi:hypothetical protein
MILPFLKITKKLMDASNDFSKLPTIKVYQFKIFMHTNYNFYQKRQKLAYYSLLKVFFNVSEE